MRRAGIAAAIVICIAVAAAGITKWHDSQSAVPVTQYRTVAITRQDITTRISATGTLEPEEVVDVGAQVAGKVIAFGNATDGKPVDYGSAVEQGSMLAKIDDVIYSSEATQAKAQLEQAQAGLVKSEADLKQMQAKANQARREWDRAQKLGQRFESQTSLDTYMANNDIAQANVEVAKAAALQAKAQITQAQANVERAARNLDYCTITSPVNGVVIDRRVNIGQTVVASLNTPSLFLIAKDLRKMQVWVSVNEADIGSIKAGQAATFTVDAIPDRVFRGTVAKVRLNASMSQNVVTYTVEVAADNSDNALIPYLTASVQFHTQERHNVLTVPSAALRWTPHSQSATQQTKAPDKSGTLWTQTGNEIGTIQVRAGITDGTVTEIESDSLREGMQVIVGEQQPGQAADSSAASNPFLPKMKPPKMAGPPPI